MKKIILFLSFVFISSNIFAQCSELFISEYVEGYSNNKGVEIYNPTSEDPNHRGLSRLHIMRAIENSLRRLGTDYVDLYQIHRR